MAFSQEVTLGANITDVFPAAKYNTLGSANGASAILPKLPHRLGQICRGNDGKEYVFARCASNTAANASVGITITENAGNITAVTSAGAGWTAPNYTPGLVTNDVAWFGKPI